MFTNNSIISIGSIGEGENALLCKTDNSKCCRSRRNQIGEFYYPNGVRVPNVRAGQGFFRNRGNQVIRLNRRPGILYPIGLYHCEIPDNNGVTQNIFAYLIPA